ncbi:DUF3551 domain-containing protein [Bradyrhizobium sp. AZCC 2289]|uniref:DUF3551 domain-containing protein n=1 Tax=Bradyrhizobium sp. AZCC 2289 TaxID=3117026 RepID=UPI002FF3467A
MRYLLSILLVIPVLVGFASGLTAAPRDRSRYIPSPPPDLYCLQGRVWGYPGNCQFSTYNECVVTASGTDAYCGANPIYALKPRGRQPR